MSRAHLSDAEIDRLLSVEPDEAILQSFSGHLEDCLDCQRRLSEAAAEFWWWNEGQRLLSCAVAEDEEPTPSKNQQPDRVGFDPIQAEINAIVNELDDPIHPEQLGQVDEFRIEEFLGAGGMGIVFKGMDQELNRPVAIKFLAPRLSNQGIARQRFAREAKATAAICHDNVVPIYRINSSWHFPFFVMPYVHGSSLEQWVKLHGTLDPLLIVQISLQIASGLAAAHEQGLIHRDIKPANILLENQCNRVVITDFGLVQSESETPLTQTGMIAGTPPYMSPEQIEGKLIDRRSDLFSVGAVMYWMATGRPPFHGVNQFELLNNVRQKKADPLRRWNPVIPKKMESVVSRLLEKRSSDRISSARELEGILQRYAAHLNDPIRNRPPKLGWRWWNGSWRLWTTTAVFVFLFLLLVVFSSSR